MTAKMSEVYYTHTTITKSLSTMDLTRSKFVNAIQKHNHQQQHQQCSHQPQVQKQSGTSTTQHECRNCTKSNKPGRVPCASKDSTWGCVDATVPGQSSGRAVGPPNHPRQSSLRKLGAITPSKEVEDTRRLMQWMLEMTMTHTVCSQHC